MAAQDFYSNHEKSKPVLAQHQALMWEVGELLANGKCCRTKPRNIPTYKTRDLITILSFALAKA